jgi:hypothetical protein
MTRFQRSKRGAIAQLVLATYLPLRTDGGQDSRDLLSAVDRPDEDRAVRHDILGKVLASELSMSNSNDHWNKHTGVPDSILAS